MLGLGAVGMAEVHLGTSGDELVVDRVAVDHEKADPGSFDNGQIAREENGSTRCRSRR